jgi:hypothetical protein
VCKPRLPASQKLLYRSKKAVAGDPAPVYRPGKDGYADWVILTVQGFKEYLNHDYRKLMNVLREMPRVAESLDLTVEALPHFSTICARKQAIPMKRWRGLFRRLRLRELESHCPFEIPDRCFRTISRNRPNHVLARVVEPNCLRSEKNIASTIDCWW